MKKFMSGLILVCFLFSSLTMTTFAAEKIRIQYMSDGWESQGGKSEYFKLSLKKFLKIHPNVDVEVFVWPGREQTAKLLSTMSIGKGPDVIQINVQRVYITAPLGYLDKPPADVVKMMEGNYYPSALEYCRDFKTGIVWGLPNYSSIRGCYFNMRVLREAGFPEPPAAVGWPWYKLVQIATKLTKFDGRGNMVQEGIGLSHRVIQRVDLLKTLIYRQYGDGVSAQTSLVNEKKKEFIFTRSAEGLRAMTLIADLFLVHKVSDKKFMDTTKGFVASKVAIDLGMVNEIIGTYDAMNPDLKNDIETRMIPPLVEGGSLAQTDSGGGGFVNANSKHKRIAWDFVKCLHDEESLYTYGKTLGVGVLHRKAMEKLTKEDPRFAFVLEGMEYGVKHLENDFVLDYQGYPIIDKVELGEITPQKGLEEIEKRMKEELDW